MNMNDSLGAGSLARLYIVAFVCLVACYFLSLGGPAIGRVCKLRALVCNVI